MADDRNDMCPVCFEITSREDRRNTCPRGSCVSWACRTCFPRVEKCLTCRADIGQALAAALRERREAPAPPVACGGGLLASSVLVSLARMFYNDEEEARTQRAEEEARTQRAEEEEARATWQTVAMAVAREERLRLEAEEQQTQRSRRRRRRRAWRTPGWVRATGRGVARSFMVVTGLVWAKAGV